MSEKISGAEGTKLDEDFMEMERVRKKTNRNEPLFTCDLYNKHIYSYLFPPLQKIEVTNKSVFELITKTTEYLQPNPGMNHRSDIFIFISLSH